MSRLSVVVLVMLCANVILFCIGKFGIGNNIFGYMTQAGRFDDFFNLFNFANDLPNPNSAIQYTGVSIFLGRVLKNSQLIATYIALIFTIAPLFIFTFLINKIDKKNVLLLIVFLVASYPILFGFARGNPTLIGVLWSLVAILSFNDSRYRLSRFSIIFGSLFHPVPAFFSLIFLCKGWTKFLSLILQIAIFQLISYLIIGGNIFFTFNKIQSSLKVYNIEYVIGGGGDLYNNSLFLIAKIAFDGNLALIEQAIKFIPLVILLVIFLQFLWTLKKYSFKESLYIVCIYYLPIYIVIASPVSADYRLGYLLIPIVLMLIHSFYRLPLFLLLLVIMPKHFIFFSSYVKRMNPNDVLVLPDLISTLGISLNSLINPALLLIALLYPMRSLMPLISNSIKDDLSI